MNRVPQTSSQSARGATAGLPSSASLIGSRRNTAAPKGYPASSATQRASSGTRRGTVILEAAITLPVLLFVIFGLLDLGLAILRQNSLAEAARRGARAAIIHGDSPETQQTVWGPSPYYGTAAAATPQADAVRPVLFLMPPSEVTVVIVWLDGKNWPGKRVQVTVSHWNQPIFPFLMPGSLVNMHAVSTMRIAH